MNLGPKGSSGRKNQKQGQEKCLCWIVAYSRFLQIFNLARFLAKRANYAGKISNKYKVDKLQEGIGA